LPAALSIGTKVAPGVTPDPLALGWAVPFVWYVGVDEVPLVYCAEAVTAARATAMVVESCMLMIVGVEDCMVFGGCSSWLLKLRESVTAVNVNEESLNLHSGASLIYAIRYLSGEVGRRTAALR
jgi:hypothetical protein